MNYIWSEVQPNKEVTFLVPLAEETPHKLVLHLPPSFPLPLAEHILVSIQNREWLNVQEAAQQVFLLPAQAIKHIELRLRSTVDLPAEFELKKLHLVVEVDAQKNEAQLATPSPTATVPITSSPTPASSSNLISTIQRQKIIEESDKNREQPISSPASFSANFPEVLGANSATISSASLILTAPQSISPWFYVLTAVTICGTLFCLVFLAWLRLQKRTTRLL